MHHAAHALVAALPSGRSRPTRGPRPAQALAWLGALGLMLALHSSPLRAKEAPTPQVTPAPAVAPKVAPASRVSPSAAPAAPTSASAPATASPPAADKKQTTRMSECSAQFKTTGQPGSERKAFMKVCLRKPKA